MKITNENISYEILCEYICKLKNEYKSFFCGVLGKTLMGRKIPLIKLGDGEKISVFVGTHHALEHITTNFLLRFCDEFLYALENRQSLYSKNVEYIAKTRSIYIIPMLNCDGVNLHLHGNSENDPLFERQNAIDNANNFKNWQANARGVDLNHNYDAGFEKMKELEAEMGIEGPSPTRYGGAFPESEEETRALCGFLRRLSCKNLRSVTALHTQGEEIYYDFQGNYPENAKKIAENAAKICGYKISQPNGIASYGGMKDWVIDKLNVPAFTFECGKGKNPLPYENSLSIYKNLAPALMYIATV